jgi:hypothetical protein
MPKTSFMTRHASVLLDGGSGGLRAIRQLWCCVTTKIILDFALDKRRKSRILRAATCHVLELGGTIVCLQKDPTKDHRFDPLVRRFR